MAQTLGAAVADTARPLARHLTGGVIDDAAHFLPEERPLEVAGRLLDFFVSTFREGESASLKLVATKSFSNIVKLTYEPQYD